MVFIPILLGFTILLGLVVRWLWRLTKKWPTPLRLLLITVVITPVITPSVFGGEGGGGPIPAVFVLLASIYSKDARQFFDDACKPLAVFGVVVYLVSGSVVLLHRLASKAKSALLD